MKQDFNCGLTVFILRLTLFLFFLIPRWCGLESWICSGGEGGGQPLLARRGEAISPTLCFCHREAAH